MTLTYSNSINHSTISSTPTSTPSKISVKPCVAKGHRECVQGFLRDRCNKCTYGSVLCGMCPSSSSSSPSPICIFCIDGRMECDDCYGTGFVQRICRDCIKEHYRRQSIPKSFSFTKVTSSFFQATVGFVKGTQQQQTFRNQRSNSSVSLPESIASSEHSTTSAPSPASRRWSGDFFLRRTSVDHERSPSETASKKSQHRRKWSSILTAA
ncbi:hypothetical protein FBU30_002461 [Linnemannia zychae]|nr:hypothetical protein FBU30_002461 [Linnemannia zychae]